MLVLAVGASAAIAAKRMAVPYNVALVVVGLLVVFLDLLPPVPLDPELILVAFLPVLVFEGALFADLDALRRSSRPILALAVPGVAISLLGTAAIATFALGLSFPSALLLGALLSITDTVSVLLAFRSVRVPQRLSAIMEGESLFNDGTALVLVSLATAVVVTGQFDPRATIHALIIAMLGGAAFGAAGGWIGAAVVRRAPDHLTAILASAVLVFATALASERAHASPVVAVVVAGLFIGRAARAALEPSRVLALHGFWETAGFGINVVLFLLVGMQIDARTLIAEAPSTLLALLALHAGRALAVYGSFAALRRVEPVPSNWQHVMVFGNIKGALSMAAVLALPQATPGRDRLVAIVFGVTFVTLVTQALPFARVLRAFGATLGPRDEELDSARATLIAARRGQAELDELLRAGLVSRKDHAERAAAYQRLVIGAEATLRSPRAEAEGDAATDLALVDAQKAALLDAMRRGLISSEITERKINELDRELIASSSAGGH